MNFDLSEEQQLLSDSIRRFAAQEYGFEARRKIIASEAGWSEAAWSTFAEMGLLGLAVPAEHGGFGGGATDLMSVMDAVGEALMVEPYLSTVLGARLVARGGTADQRESLLPEVAQGRMKLALAFVEEDSRYDLARVETVATRSGAAYRLRGAKRMVLHAPIAERILATASLDGRVALFMMERPPGLRAYRTLDNLRAADLALEEAPAELVDADALALVEEAVDFATALLCAEAVGAMRFANDTTLEYLKTRKQFGVAIGSFQALQHRMVDMVISLEQARSMASLACSEVDAAGDPAERKRTVSAAKIRIADACRHISQESVQLHGGMGMSDELKVSHTFRRLTTIAQQFGDADHHLERYASL